MGGSPAGLPKRAMPPARYDAIAEFYAAGWVDSYDDPVTAALFTELGPVDGLTVLDLACGHGPVTRELARRGARVVGVDISGRLLDKAAATERSSPLGVRYVRADVTAWAAPARGQAVFDAVVCSFGLSDIDDLDGALHTVSAVLRTGGRFVFSILHPCFAGGADVSGAWPTSGSYHDEGWWVPDGAASTLRRTVGTTHRMLSTYVNALRRHGLLVEAMVEPPPPPDWRGRRTEAARFPVFLVVRCLAG